ncbi:ribonuclease P/MRP subunit POP4 [Lycorma delicatula]|uniref:ribonuclease P/MRP subunit POP4 n=1 Tax=Lycorma delicatula TaxID=130591 RepID=UPI003F50FBE0
MSNPKVVKLISELPDTVLKKIGCSSDKNIDVDEFLKSKLLESHHSEISVEMGKHFVLGKVKHLKKNKRQVRTKTVLLNANEKRHLGIYKLPKSGLKYQDVEMMYSLWCQYMRDYLQINILERNGFTGDPACKHWDTVSTKLLKADLHGAYLIIIRSTIPSFVGIKGIVILERKNIFQITGKDNITRTIPKKQCEFSVKLDCYKFTFFGKDICMRSSERSVKKYKTQMFNFL